MPGDDGNAMALNALRKFSSRRRSKTGWVMAYSAPASTLKAKRRNSCSMSGTPGLRRHRGEVGADAMALGSDVEAVIQAAHDI